MVKILVSKKNISYRWTKQHVIGDEKFRWPDKYINIAVWIWCHTFIRWEVWEHSEVDYLLDAKNILKLIVVISYFSAQAGQLDHQQFLGSFRLVITSITNNH